MIRTFFSILATFLIATLLASIGILWLFYVYGQDLPDYKQLENYEPPVVSRLYAGDGRLFAEYAVERRVFVPISAIPRRIVRTFLAAEDKNFYQHPGIDALGIVRAALNNMLNQKTTMGASTITQQVAKNFFLSSERSFSRKIKEAILAFRIENTLSKDRILELYLNQIYLGQGSYGVAAAALNYFNKSLDELTIEEAAYIAALPKAPNNYHPDRHPEAARGRRNWVIARMVEEHVISTEEGEEAKNRPIILRQRDEADVVHADYFAEEVRRELMTRYGADSLYQGGLVVRTTLAPQYQAAADRALRAGLLAYDRRHGWRGPLSTLPPQKTAQDWLAVLKTVERPRGLGLWHLAVVTHVEPHQATILTQQGEKGHILLETLKWARPWQENESLGPAVSAVSEVLKVGDVVAVERQNTKEASHLTPEHASEEKPSEAPQNAVFELCQIPSVGGAILVMDPHTGRILALSGGFSYEISQFNRATQALRQPGSSFKPVAYLAALEAGRTPSSIIMDAPITIELGPGQPIWKPKNISHKFYGPITLRSALEHSRNASTIRLAQEIGMKKICDVAERLGIVDHLPRQLAMVLGAGETTVKKMTTAFCVFVNGGKSITPTLIDRIQDRQGKTIYRHDQRQCSACQQEEWEDAEMPILPDERGQLIDPIHAYQIVSMLEGAVKRGTARKAQVLNRPVAGKTGTTNDFMDNWFIGFTPDLVVGVFVGFDAPRTLGNNEVGSRTALPIFIEFMQEALKDEPKIPFRVPPGAKLMRVSEKTGKPVAPGATDAILEAFKPGTEPNATTLSSDEATLPTPTSGSQTTTPTAVGTGQIY